MRSTTLPVRVGFIGTGLIARSHARGLSATNTGIIAACHDLDADRCEEFARSTGAQVVESADAVIEASDAVYICTWTAAHPALVSKVVAAGRAVFCEKPLAVDLATAQSMTDGVIEAGVTNQVGLVLRRTPPLRWLAAMLASGEAGEVMSIVFRDDQYIPIQGTYGSTWRSDVDRAGAGTLLEHSIHDLDLIAWMLGDDDPIEKVAAHTANFAGHRGIEDLAQVSLTTGSGATASLTSVWHDVMSRPSQRRIEVFCRRGWFHLDNEWTGPVEFDIDGRQGTLDGDDLARAATELDGMSGLHTNPDAAFVAAVADGRPAAPDFTVALAAHRLCDAAYRSAATGSAPVTIDR